MSPDSTTKLQNPSLAAEVLGCNVYGKVESFINFSSLKLSTIVRFLSFYVFYILKCYLIEKKLNYKKLYSKYDFLKLLHSFTRRLHMRYS